MPLLITVPVYGQHEYTHALVGDLEREGADYLIVDNRGDYPKVSNERVISPGNLRWTGATDLGFRLAFSEGYSHAMTLNNDTRISKGFVAALIDPRLPADAGIVGPMFDRGYPCSEADQKPDAANYTPRPLYRAVPAVEGTALVLSLECWQTIGGLDLRSFGRHEWASDFDLVLRARKAGYGVYTTEMAYINHFGHKTANARFGRLRYQLGGRIGMEWNMRKVYGRKWLKHFPRGSLARPVWPKADVSATYTVNELASRQ